MREALALAGEAAALARVPVGAVAVKDGEVVGRGHNRREIDRDPFAHAELLAHARGGQGAGGVAADRSDGVRDARAVRDVRRGDGAGASRAAGVRRGGSQGGGGWARSTISGRAEAQPPRARSPRECWRRSAAQLLKDFFQSLRSRRKDK